MAETTSNQDEKNALAELAGPFYDTAGLISWLGCDVEEINQRIEAGSLIACPTQEGEMIYPVWQFTKTGELKPALATVVKALSEGTSDGWTIAVWLSTKLDDLDGKSTYEWLDDNGGIAPVLRVAYVTKEAEHDAAVWKN